jgi:NADP-dependent 3-hydroxy acid dehydrogenase YdfG
MDKRKSVLITGCSAGGIGDALAQSFHSHGFRVFATARNLSKVAHLKELGMEIIELDVINEESVKRAAETVSAATQKTLDVLVNNSGTSMSLAKSAEFVKMLI